MPPADPSRRRTLAVCLVLFLGTIALFARAWDYGFTNYDDPRYVTENLHVQGGLGWAGLVWAFLGNADYFHPLTWISHMLDWQLYGADATGHRLTSILWHAVNAVLAFFVVRRVSGLSLPPRARAEAAGRLFWLSALSAALFAWHPLRVESVVWVTERKDVMSGFFFLLTIWAYVGYAEKRRVQPAAAWRGYALALAAFAGGLMSKPVIVALPGVLVALDFWPLRRFPFAANIGTQPPAKAEAAAKSAPAQHAPESWRTLVLEKVPFAALSLGIAALTVWMQHGVHAFTVDVPFGARIANAFVALARYLGKFFWPFELTAIYPHPGTWPAVVVIAAALLFVAITAAALRQWRARPWLAAGWGWFLVMFVPSIGLVQAGFQSMADRYTYLPILGLQLALVPLLAELPWRRLPRWLPGAAAGAVLAALAVRTWSQEGTWRDSDTLYEHALAVTQNNYVAHGFLSLNLVEQKRLDEAERHARRALELKPDYGTAHYALAAVRRSQGRIDEAIAGMRRNLELEPHNLATELELGLLLLQKNQTPEAAAHFAHAYAANPDVFAALVNFAHDEATAKNPRAAIALYRQALALRSDDAPAHHNLGVLLAAQGRPEEALAQFEEAMRLAPTLAQPHIDGGAVLLRLGRAQAAGEQFRKAAGLEPENAAALLGLSRALEQLGHGDEALAALRRAVAANPRAAALHAALGDALGRRRDIAGAAAEYEEAVRLQPDDAATRARLGFTLLLLRRPAEAATHWEEALRLDPNLPGLRERLEQVRRDLAAGR